MYKLQKLNVERIVNDESSKNRLILQGYKLVEEKKQTNESIDYSSLTLQELQSLCKENNLEGYTKLSKENLVKFVEENLSK